MAETKPYTHIARLYDLLDLPFEFGRYRPLRQLIWAGLHGRMLDAGVGTGRNMAYYPTAGEVIGIDLSPAMLKRALARKRRLKSSVRLAEMDIKRTGFADHRFDAIVSTFLFCVLDDTEQLPALKELRRIIKPEGTVRILEYAYSTRPLKRFIMTLWAPWVRWAYGASFDRQTEKYIESAGFELVERRFVHGDIIKLLILRPIRIANQ